MSWLTQAAKGIKALASQKKDIPDNLWRKCPSCSEVLYHRELDRNLWVCGSCGHHLPFSTEQYLDLLIDEGTWQETHMGITSVDALDFKDSKRYKDRIRASRQKTGKEDAVISGRGQIGRVPVSMSIMDFSFMGGSMGSVVGEKISRALLDSLRYREAAIILSRSGGARMQEALLSLMQMAKTSAVLSKLRVIKQTIGGDLPEGFQSSEFLMEKGQVDIIAERGELKSVLERTLHWFVDGRDVSVRRPPRG